MCIFLHSKNLLYFCDNFQHWFNWRWRLCTIKLWIKKHVLGNMKKTVFITLLIVVVATGCLLSWVQALPVYLEKRGEIKPLM